MEIEDPLGKLVVCRCSHYLSAHDYSGCRTSRCRCGLAKDAVIESELSAIRGEIHRQYDRLRA
jgi:hypothetical protein